MGRGARSGRSGDEERDRLMAELYQLIDAGAQGEGITESPLPGLSYFRASRTGPRVSILIEPTLCIVASGEKKAHVGNEVFTYDAETYRVLAVPLPVDVEITRADEAEPLLAIALGINLATLTEVVLEMEDVRPPSEHSLPPRGIYTSTLDYDLLAAVNRLLRAVVDERKREVLAPLAEREILFHLLSGDQGDVLHAIALRDGRAQRVGRALRFIRNHYREALDIEAIARAAFSSPSALHHDFKAVTSISPIQYLKQIRLHEARLLMLHEDRSAAGAARAVGYRSPSQFSREYRRLFGAPPAEHVDALQAVRA